MQALPHAHGSLLALFACALALCSSCGGDGPVEGEVDEQARQALELGLQALEAGNTRTAMRELTSACERAPEWTEAWASLCAAAWIAHDPDQLVRASRWLLEQEHGTWRVAERMAEAALGAGLYESAEEAVAWLVEERPRSPGTRLMQARLAFELGQLGDARMHARAALQAAEPEAEAHHIDARVWEEHGKQQEALEAYRAALAINPGHQGARDALALLLDRAGLSQESARHRELHSRISSALGRHFRARPAQQRVEQFGPLVEELPGWIFGRIELATALLELERVDEAQELVRETLSMELDNSRANQLMGRVLSSLGDRRGAERHFERARALGTAR